MKILVLYLKKIIMAIMMGIGSSFGKLPNQEEEKDNKTIGSNK